MRDKSNRICKSIFCVVIMAMLILSIVPQCIVGRSNIDINLYEKKDTNIKPIMVQLFNNIFSKINSNKPILSPRGIFSSNIHTNCDGIGKTTEIMYGSTTEIDVDNNPNTGNENGADINVKYTIYPSIEINYDIVIGLIFSLTINRLGEEIKESDFTISLELGDDLLRLGYWSPSETGNQIPDYTSVSLKIFFQIFQRTRGVNLNIEPIYDNGNENKKIELFSEVNSETFQQRSSVRFNPTIESSISFISTKKQGVWQYDFHRESTEESEVTINFTNTEGGNTKETIITIDKLPIELEFLLGLTPLTQGGGSFLYESSDMYNIELQVKGNDFLNSFYSILRNTPRRIYAEWIPALDNGEYHIDIDSDGTDFIIRDSEIDPFINFEINGIKTVDLDVYWNLTNPGTYTVYKNNAINVELDFSIGDWVAEIIAQPTANYVDTTWFIDTSGYLTFDTNSEPLSTIDFLIKGPLVGLNVIGESFIAEDFKISWTLWPPQQIDITVTGLLEFISVSIDIYLIDGWYHLWPW